MERLRPEVIPPARPKRTRALAIASAVLFTSAALNAMIVVRRQGMRHDRVRIHFGSVPERAAVMAGNGEALCETPCTIQVDRQPRTALYRLMAPGYDDRYLSVHLDGGDTEVEAVLAPR